ncbi:MAG: ribonuclease P protein component [Bacteroidales bacterium]|nr:ribonuclease P protein component [Bacteroidales bacterium]
MTVPDINRSESFSFEKGERLCSKKEIEALFSSGKGFIVYPLRVVYLVTDDKGEFPSIMCTVPKRRFKRAVDRNRIKRLIRESYRLNKSLLFEFLKEKGYTLNIAFIFLGEELPKYQLLEQSMNKAFVKLKEKLS